MIRKIVLFVAVLLICLPRPHEAKAGWRDLGYVGCSGQDFGADYYDAVIGTINCEGGGMNQDWWVQGFLYDNYGQVEYFSMCHPGYDDDPPLCVFASLDCSAGGMPTVNGCVTDIDYPGCNCGSPNPAQDGGGTEPNGNGSSGVVGRREMSESCVM